MPSCVELGSSIISLWLPRLHVRRKPLPPQAKELDYEIVNGRMTEKISGSLPSVETLAYFRLLRCFFIFHLTPILSSFFPGYGNITPVTTGGRVLCIFYAFFGIPINILFLQLVGERMLQVEQHLVTRFEATFLNKEGVPKFLNEKCSLLGFVLLVILLLISARTQKAIDDWTFFEGFYAYFITYTTVGFGDLIPGDKVRSPGHTTVRVIFIILGLAAMSNVINALVKCTECLRWLTRLTARCGRNKSADRPGETEGNGELELKAVKINHASEI